jgi:16S rRNA (guanine1516-N2)-methyltransferase
MLVTTTARPNERMLMQAEALSSELGALLMTRGNRTLTMIMKAADDAQILVVEQQGLRLATLSGSEFFFHPSMAMVRVKRLLAGEKDKMLDAADVRLGDTIIDCTMGLASDSIVFAHAAGANGTVIALESEQLPYVLAREGLQAYSCGLLSLEQAMRRIKPVHADHLEYLRRQPDRSADIVYFDPMFRRSAASDAIEPLREVANSLALRAEAVAEASRVARRTIIMKEHNRSGEFERLGFQPVKNAHSKITYGVIAL